MVVHDDGREIIEEEFFLIKVTRIRSCLSKPMSNRTLFTSLSKDVGQQYGPLTLTIHFACFGVDMVAWNSFPTIVFHS